VRVVVAESAAADFLSITDYFGARSPSATDAMVDRILAVAQVLGSHPWIGHAGRMPGTREFVVARTPYVIVYSITGELLTILRVLHSKQQWPPV